ncbi:DUF2877 domain-containing protein [Yokenella regensburgei]|uniref:DUF2877 domain-containing protein n=1 Tax=Yokenella regensburgei TaxID=158877 RepID=UPI001432ED75|nr:DUF2877 domain-containing protein [Yokenella regensburgei]QIU90155.1 DUF2877 domain-containing protein [Yokenella regensburgei]
MNTTPQRQWVQALTADEGFLSLRGSGRVEQVFRHAVNLFIPEQQRLFTLLSEGCDNAPNSCRLALTHCDTLFRPGEQIIFSDTGITIAQDKGITTRGCQRWQPEKWVLTTERFTEIPWRGWFRNLRQQLDENDTLFCYRGEHFFYREIACRLQQRRKDLFRAIQQGENISPAVTSLMGLGIGLTPSGDDYLVGLAIILFISGHPLEKYRDVFLSALQAGRNNTTLLSAITLEAAFAQRYRENIGRLTAEIMAGKQTATEKTLSAIKNIGSSSGCDMLYGMADACALSYLSGENYVNQDCH